MTEINLQISEEVLSLSSTQPEELSQAILTSAAMKLYQAKKLSSGKAAQLAGLSRVQFFEELGSAEIPLYEPTLQEFSAELELIS